MANPKFNVKYCVLLPIVLIATILLWALPVSSFGIEGLTVVDLMRRAGIRIQTVSIKKEKKITTSHGIEMFTDITMDEADFTDADMLVLPIPRFPSG